MAESAVVRVAREYREQLARNEDAALKRMARYWVQMEGRLRSEYESLYFYIRELRESGQAVPQQYIYTLDRYQRMMAQIGRELPYYQATVEDLIAEYQREDFILGLDGASSIIKANDPSAEIWNRVYKDAAETVAGFAGNGAPLSELLRTDYGALGEKITDALVSGVALGKGVKETVKDMQDATASLTYERAVRIARTEINRAYRIANQQQYAASGVVEKVLRLCYKPTACLACLEMDGEECKNGICDDHPNGKCTTVAVTIGGNYPQWQHGHDWLMEQSEEDQRRIMGPGRFEMWKKDGVPLRDMVEMKPNAVWGSSPQVISETKLRQTFNLQPRQVISVPNVAQQATTKSVLPDTFTKLLDGVDYLPCKDLAKSETQDQIIAVLGGGDQTHGSCASVALAYAGRSNGIDVHDFRDGKSREWFANKANKRTMAQECGLISQSIKDFSKTGWEKLKSANLEDGVDYLLGYACHMSVIRKNGSAFEYLELQSTWNNGWHKLTASDLKRRFGASDSGRYDVMDIYDVRSCTGDKFKEVLGYLNTEPGKEHKGKGGTIK